MSIESKARQARRQGGRCYWCLSRFYFGEPIHAEHVYPKSRGGSVIVASCVRCNLQKGTRHPAIFVMRRIFEMAHLMRYPFDIFDPVESLLLPIDELLAREWNSYKFTDKRDVQESRQYWHQLNSDPDLYKRFCFAFMMMETANRPKPPQEQIDSLASYLDGLTAEVTTL
jgi:hypothetical protein